MVTIPSIALGFVDFTSSAVNFGFELDNGSANRTRAERLLNGSCPVLSMDLLEDRDRIRLGGTLQRGPVNFRNLERPALVDRRELRLRETDWL